MQDTLISFQTAKLAKEKGFNITLDVLNSVFELEDAKPLFNVTRDVLIASKGLWILRPTQSLLQKFIREKRGVHIEVHRNASGYYWSMCKSDGGTDLGWSDYTGPNLGGVWDSFEDALENALQVQLSYNLPNSTKVIKHWGNYVEFAIDALKDKH